MDKEFLDVPFPQADNILRVLDLLKQLGISRNIKRTIIDEKDMENILIQNPSAKEIATFFGIADRQGAYYGDALSYLSLCVKKSGKYYLTPSGNYIQTLNTNDKMRNILQRIFKSPVFRKSYIHKVNNNGELNTVFIEQLLQEYVPELESPITRKRRARTVNAWVNWIYKNY